MSDFQVGWRVKIVPGSRYYGTSESNPADVAGVVIRTDNTYEHTYRVEWDNGTSNAYAHTDLFPLQEGHKPREKIFQNFTESFI